MKTIFLLKTVFSILIVSTIAFSSFASEFYVSPFGNDSDAGTKEHPFATLEQAKSVIEDMIQDQKESVFTIWLAGGIYEITNPVVFESVYFNDGIEVEIKAMPNSSPVISGGVELKNWNKTKKGFWAAHLPEKTIIPDFRELFINNERATRARVPNKGYLRVKKVGSDRRTNFVFDDNDFPVPENSSGVELVFFHDWSVSRIAVKTIDAKSHRITLVDWVGARAPSFFNMDNWEPNPRYFLENAFEFLDANYEWFFDSKKKTVFLKLPENINPNAARIVVPVSKKLIEIKGTEKLPVADIHFEGIEFKHCSWSIPKNGYCGVQACFHDSRTKPAMKGWSAVPAAIKAEWAQNCTFENCVFRNFGGSGLWFATGTKNCSVKNSSFYNISGNGIMIGEGHSRIVDGDIWWKKVPEQTALGNSVENCSVGNCGVQFFGAIGIWCGISAETTIRNNEIFDLPYSGISIGWEWSPAKTPCRANVVDGNHIHHVLKVLSDGGGIYMLGLQPGSKLISNQIHDVKINAGRAESNGMFLDEGTTDVLIANNLIYNIAKSPLRFHRATVNLIKDNYLFCTGDNPPIRYNRTNEEDIKKVNNKVFHENDANYKEELSKIIKKWEEHN